MDPIDEFWNYLIPNLQYLQDMDAIVRDIAKFMATYNSDPVGHEKFNELSHSSQILVNMNELLGKIDESLAVYIDQNMFGLSERAGHILMLSYKKTLHDDGLPVPDINPIPIICRYEIILSTNDPSTVHFVEKMYLRYKQLTRKGLTTPYEWMITKYKRSIISRNNNPCMIHKININDFTFRGRGITDAKFILQINHMNEIDFLLFVGDVIQTQSDIEEFRQDMLTYIDLYIGEARSYKYIKNFTLLPLSSYNTISLNFPQHYKLQDWSEFTTSLLNLIPDHSYCKSCYIGSQNADTLEISEPPETEIISTGTYCRYCFSFLARLVKIEQDFVNEYKTI